MLPTGDSTAGFDVVKKSNILALSYEQSGIHVGSDGNIDRSFRMAKASTSQPAEQMICEKCVS